MQHEAPRPAFHISGADYLQELLELEASKRYESISRQETHWNVIADKVPVALLGVELHGEAAHIAQALGRPAQLAQESSRNIDSPEENRLSTHVQVQRSPGPALVGSKCIAFNRAL